MPGKPLFIVGRSIQHVRIIPVHGQVDHSDFLVIVQDFPPGFSSIRGFKHSAFLIGGKKMTLCGHVDDIRVGGMDKDSPDMMRIFQSHVGECLAAVCGFINPVAPVRAPGCGVLSGPHPEDVRIGGSQGDVADREDILVVKERLKCRSVVGRLPQPAVSSGHIKGVEMGLERGFRDRKVADPGTAAERSQVPVSEIFQKLLIRMFLA